MSNHWFQFRHFLIRQDQSAMKVGTDGVLLGAWADCSNCRFILDIGTGTGLLALMITQRNPVAWVSALEIDPAAAKQAEENAKSSAWSGRIAVTQCDFRYWMPGAGVLFDLIICNPPFFTRSLKNPDIVRAKARHDDDLPLHELITRSSGLLSASGKLALILPVGRIEEAMAVAQASGLFLWRRMDVRGNAHASVKRVLVEWGREDRPAGIVELVIETDVRGVYSEEYRRMTEDFYLGV